jgi:hypothetical protein
MSNNIKDAKQDLKEFFKILDIQEESEEGRMFHPTFISCCRSFTLVKLNGILSRLKQYSEEE